MKVAISVETTVDLDKATIEKYDLKVVPFSITLGDKTYFDGEVSTDDIIGYVNETGVLPKTSAVNCAQYDKHFGDLLKDYDAVVHFALSSEISSACNNAILSSKNFENVFVIDTKTLSTGIALIALYAKELADKGETAQDIYNKCLQRVPYIQASFELNRVDYLYKGGRCSALTLLGANLLKIRPQIIVKDGKLVSGKRYRGNYRIVVSQYCQDILAEFNTPDLSRVFLTYTTADKEVLDTAYQILVDAGFKEILYARAGGTITSHCGENCLGILYINDAK